METRVLWEHNELILEAGQAHGVAKNDEYRLQAPWGEHPETTEPIIFKVKTVYALSSALEAVDANTNILMIKTAWRAIPCTHLSKRQVSVRLSSRLQHDQWQKIIAASSFLKPSVGLVDISSPLSGVFIDIKDGTDYQILDERMCRIPGLPTVSIASSSAISDTVSVLDHVAKFKYVESLDNRVPDPDFERSIRIQLANSVGNVAEDMGVLDVTHGETVLLRCLNLSKEPAYLSIFNLSPLWRIENLLMPKYGDFKDLSPSREGFTQSIADIRPLKIKMTVPDELDAHGKCGDVIKVFVTSRPVSLSSLRLPGISLNNRQLEPSIRSGGRSMMELLERLSPTTRGPSNTIVDERWLTRNFVIHVSK
jgi:hypothetical protein